MKDKALSGKEKYELEVCLMGNPTVSFYDKKVKFPYRKAEALFYYLCVNNEVTRNQLISVLWADSKEVSARKNLRDAVYNIRKLFGADILVVQGNTKILLNRNRRIKIDIEDDEMKCGKFLEFFFVKECYEFEEWVEEERNSRQKECLRKVKRCILKKEIGDDLETLEKYGQILVQNEVMDEELYRCIMRKLAKAGYYEPAIELYHELSYFLKKRVEEQPEKETTHLFEKISEMKRNVKNTQEKQQDFFFGRTDILYEICSKINVKGEWNETGPKSFWITGEAGAGKSMLLKQAQHMLEDNNLIIPWECCEMEEKLYLKSWIGICAKLEECCNERNLKMESPAKLILEQKEPESPFLMTRIEILMESILSNLIKKLDGEKIIFILDDIQWMDSMSLQIMTSMLFRMKNEQIILIAASREANSNELRAFMMPLVNREILKEIELKPFTWEEAKMIFKKKIGNQREEEFAQNLYKRTQGNPLFLMESLKLCQREKKSENFTKRIKNEIESCLIGLSQKEKILLKALAYFEHPVELNQINITGIKEFELFEALQQLIDKKIIVQKSENQKIYYKFRNQMIQEYVQLYFGEEKVMCYA